MGRPANLQVNLRPHALHCPAQVVAAVKPSEGKQRQGLWVSQASDASLGGPSEDSRRRQPCVGLEGRLQGNIGLPVVRPNHLLGQPWSGSSFLN